MIEKAVTLLKPGGRMRVAIPNEGTLMWRLGTMVTGYEFKKRYGLDYQVLMKHEHVNTADEIEEILKFYFKNVRCSVFGLNKKLAFYKFYNCMMA
jgi:predicted SAM-dependent methyltransferase